MSDRAPIPRRAWCGLVAALCNPDYPASSSEALWTMLPALEHLPDEVFTPSSAREVASRRHAASNRRHSATPAFDELATALDAYRLTYVPDTRLALPAPVAPDRTPPSESELRAVSELVASLPKPRPVAFEARPPSVRPPAAPLFNAEQIRKQDAISAWRREQMARLTAPADEETRQ